MGRLIVVPLNQGRNAEILGGLWDVQCNHCGCDWTNPQNGWFLKRIRRRDGILDTRHKRFLLAHWSNQERVGAGCFSFPLFSLPRWTEYLLEYALRLVHFLEEFSQVFYLVNGFGPCIIRQPRHPFSKFRMTPCTIRNSPCTNLVALTTPALLVLKVPEMVTDLRFCNLR